MPGNAEFDRYHKVREAVPILRLIAEYTLVIQEGERFLGTCPWHDDTQPSLVIDPSRKHWSCWVCKESGDAIQFVMKSQGMTQADAVALLVRKFDVEL